MESSVEDEKFEGSEVTISMLKPQVASVGGCESLWPAQAPLGCCTGIGRLQVCIYCLLVQPLLRCEFTSMHRMYICLPSRFYWWFERIGIWIGKSQKLEPIFGELDFHFWIAQLAFWGQTRYTKVLDSTTLINTFCHIMISYRLELQYFLIFF